MEKHHKLQKVISEIIEPNLEDRLVFGCEIYDKYEKETLTIIKPNYNNDKLRVQIQNNGLLDFNFGQNDCEVLGLPINLERLLLVIAISNPSNAKHKNILYDYSSGEIGYSNRRISWHLGKDISEQPNMTKYVLYELFNIE